MLRMPEAPIRAAGRIGILKRPVPGKIARMPGAAMLLKIGAPPEECVLCIIAAQADSNRKVLQSGSPDLDQINQRIAEVDINRHLRIARHEARQRRRDMRQTEGHRRRHTHLPAYIGRLLSQFGFDRSCWQTPEPAHHCRSASCCARCGGTSMLLTRASSRVIAFETVPCDSDSSAAARAKEPVSATLAKIAHASRSGSLFKCSLQSSPAPPDTKLPSRLSTATQKWKLCYSIISILAIAECLSWPT